ncbi:IS3 family transposase, partial [Micromonospora sp. CPCC 206060]|uniref:IS3 family transposase n=1 Tax=Micromonospora sp. CPCC 206060 TaxID=3122406 RepID=UPI002FF3DBD2
MGTSKYTPEFRADAVALYHASPGRTYASVAQDLGVNHETLRVWVREAEQAAVPGAAESTALEKENRQLKARVRELELEREILRRAALVFRGRDQLVSRFQFVADHHDAYGVKRLCGLLSVSRSGFYRWREAAPARAERGRADQVLTERIIKIHQESDSTYGSPRITAELREQGRPVNHKRVERLMRRGGIVGVHLRRKVRTTVPAPDAAPVPDLIGRDFTAPAPNRKYVGDITYLPVGDGRFLYLATVLDLYSKRLVGWSIADHMRTELVADALTAAAGTRGNLRGAIFHSDNGAQGGFNWSSQHLDHGGLRWGTARSGYLGYRLVRGASGRRIGRCDRRCVHRDGRSRLVRCSGTFGGGLRREQRRFVEVTGHHADLRLRQSGDPQR